MRRPRPSSLRHVLGTDWGRGPRPSLLAALRSESAPPSRFTSGEPPSSDNRASTETEVRKGDLTGLLEVLTPQQRRQLGVLVGAAMVSESCTSVVSPVLPIFAAQMSLGGFGLGLLTSAPYLARVALNLPFGRLADRRSSRVPMMVAGEATAALGTLSTGVAAGMPTLLPSRMAVGAGGAAAEAGTMAFLADFTSLERVRKHRGTIYGLKASAGAAGWLVGPVLGGALASTYGPQATFATVAALTGACAVAYCTLEPNLSPAMRPGQPVAAAKPEQSMDSDEHPAALTLTANDTRLLACQVALYINYAAFTVVVPMQAVQLYGASPMDLGLLYSAVAGVGVLGSPMAGALTDKLGRKAGIVPGLAICAAGVTGVGLADSTFPLFGSMCAWAVGEALVGPSLTSLAADIAPPHLQGTYLARVRQSGDFALLAGPILLGAIVDLADASTALAVVAGASIAALGPALHLEVPCTLDGKREGSPVPASAAVASDSAKVK